MIKVNGEAINYSLFPFGEVKVEVPEHFLLPTDNIVSALLRNSNDLMSLLLVTDAIKRTCPATRVSLFLPYVPYGRQDRVNNEGEPLSVKVFADLLNNLGFSEIQTLDPHSDVTTALINNLVVVSQYEALHGDVLMLFEAGWGIVCPDAGAAKKLGNVLKNLALEGVFPEVIQAQKIRDTKTGAITGTVLHGDPAGKDWVIVDDLCDGGRTFVELGKALRAGGARKVSLSVTHGGFTAGFDELRKTIDRIYCTYCWCDVPDDGYVQSLEG
jgi:ribose-phosphate pyrophosphokinase